MRAVAQRVSSANVVVEGDVVGEIGRGLLVYLGAAEGDQEGDVAYIARKLAGLRVFTLFGDVRRGLRPSFDDAAPPDDAERLYQEVVRQLREDGIAVETGRFRASMKVTGVVDGPVTILIDSRKLF